jgi:hypothetical protein
MFLSSIGLMPSQRIRGDQVKQQEPAMPVGEFDE